MGSMEMSQGDDLVSSDPTTKGFDLSAGDHWIYPLNYQVREYQFNIAKNALFSNTLVCLPTGLGKTLIAAVVMYNFWRWYPRGKVVFLAPTKPLLAQQIVACQDMMGIPSVDTIELTGTMNPKNRQIAWFNKRVIFATPQVFQNDLEKEIASGDMVRCVVIDEAHKALGKHSYCESLRLLQTQNKCFRVLALSATPGSKIEDVCQVMKNLLISNLELRDETSRDIIPYLNKRQLDIILVPLDNDLARFKEKYVSIMDRHIRLLVQYKVLNGSAGTITKGRIFYLYKEFQSKTNKPGNYNQIMKTISRCMSLYHAYDLLIRHGLRAFTSFCETHSKSVWITDEPGLQELIREVQEFLGPFPNIHPLPDGSVEEIPKDLVLGHTKFHKLRSLLLEHFAKFAAKNNETRAIVFVEYRDSVNEVYVSLLQSRPTIRPKMLVGQAGQKRKQQMQAMDAFRNNEANVLISTSVGEEGLDVGEVDLIVCFDISQSSPTRLVQRMGRTGRRRDGRIVMLVTDGKEHQALKSTIAKKDSLNNKVLHSSNVVSALYQESPRMVPPDMDPVCSKRHIVLHPKIPTAKGKRKRTEKEDDPQKDNDQKPAKVAKSSAAMPREGAVTNSKPTQSSMWKFLKKAGPNEETEKVSTQSTQLSQGKQLAMQVAHPDSIKLFTSDTAMVEFLTLCAIKASKSDGVQDEFNRIDKTYVATISDDDADQFFCYPVPDLDILNCLAFLEETNESLSPEVNKTFYNGQMDDEVHMPEPNRFDGVECLESDEPLADGKFDYENLFQDSCESDEMTEIDDEKFVTSINNPIKLCQSEEIGEFQSCSDAEEDAARILTQKDEIRVSGADERRCDGENYFPKMVFESILDASSDSEDIPANQVELDSNIKTKTRTMSWNDFAVPEKQSAVGIEQRIGKPCTSFASNIESENQENTPAFVNETSRSTTNSYGRNTEGSKRWTLTLNSNRSVDVNKLEHSNDRRASCLSDRPQSAKVNEAENTVSRFFSSKHNEHSDVGIKFNCKTEDQYAVKSENQSLETKPVLDEDDDDVIFIEEIDKTRAQNNSRTESIDVPNDKGDDDVVFEREISFTKKTEANGSRANCGASTLTQILDFIETFSPKRISPSNASKNSKNLSKFDKLKLVSASEPSSSHIETLPKEKPAESLDSVSRYFFHDKNKVANVDASLKTEELFQDELDLSDLKWDDEFIVEKKDCDSEKICARLDERLDSKLATSPLNKKEVSFRTDSESPVIFNQSEIREVKSPTKKMTEFGLEDFEWDSDFETPGNPVESLRQFSMSNETSSPIKTNYRNAVGSASEQSSSKYRALAEFSSLTKPGKKKLSLTRKSKTLKPSTSERKFAGDSDFEDNIFHKPDRKYKSGKDHSPTTNYALITNRSPLISKQSKWFKREKENSEPNRGLVNLSSFSASQKDEDERKVPFSRGVLVDRDKVASLDRFPSKGKRHRRRNRIRTEFLDYEAEISSDTSSGTSGDDDDLDGFVSHTQESPTTVDMHGHYLQSIKDVHRNNGFRFKRSTVVVPDDEVFSQSESQDSSYLLDSFCVSGGEDDFLDKTRQPALPESNGLSKVSKNKKRKNSTNGRTSTSKRRRLVERLTDSNSSEDETEKLRKQILEESFDLKRQKY